MTTRSAGGPEAGAPQVRAVAPGAGKGIKLDELQVAVATSPGPADWLKSVPTCAGQD